MVHHCVLHRQQTSPRQGDVGIMKIYQFTREIACPFLIAQICERKTVPELRLSYLVDKFFHILFFHVVVYFEFYSDA